MKFRSPVVVMKICGWKDFKTMEIYIRMAGIDISGATDGLKLMPERDAMARVVDLFGGYRGEEGRGRAYQKKSHLLGGFFI
ncbi:MAG: hypothetical protein ABL958_16315 [Bdellovibrionia bacterium]